MSLSNVRPFFRERLNSIGFREHADGFDDTNREQTLMEKLYRLDTSNVVGAAANMQSHEFEMDCNVVITLRGQGTRNVELYDRSFEVAEQVYAEILAPANRNGTNIKDIIPTTILVTENSASNDNDLIITIGFTCNIYCEFID